MPVTNTVRSVLNSSSGRWFLWDRDGDRFEPLPANGVALTATGAGTNAVHIYRITTDNGEFKPMVATAQNPATLKVYVKDPASGNMVLKETVACTSFADSHCGFILAGDYAAETTKYVRLDFTDGTIGGITASFSSVTLYEQRESVYQNKVGTWKALAAAVTGIDDRRVRFESSDPSVCMIERGAIDAINWINVGETAIQTDQACMLVGVTKGTCTITCISEADENLTAQVTVEVKVHPDDEQRPASGGALAAEVTAMLHNVRAPIRLIAPVEGPVINGYRSNYITSGTTFLWLRTFVMPGDENDWFDIALNFAGLVPRDCFRHEPNIEGGGGLFLVFATVTRPCLGVSPMFVTRNRDDNGYFMQSMSGMLAAMEAVSGAVLNDHLTDNEEGDNTSTINKTLTFRFQGGETFVLAWLFSGNGIWGPGLAEVDLPYDTNYHALMTVSACTHHPANEAP